MHASRRSFENVHLLLSKPCLVARFNDFSSVNMHYDKRSREGQI